MTELAGLARRLDTLASAVSERGLTAAMKKAGVEGKKLADQAVQGDIGDMSMSNWRRGKPIPIKTRFDFVGDSALEFKPQGRAGGPMRVLQDGRRAGTARSGRPVSATRGRGTWGKATESMEKQLPLVVHDEVQKVLGKLFGR